jgi:hypothetical protein
MKSHKTVNTVIIDILFHTERSLTNTSELAEEEEEEEKIQLLAVLNSTNFHTRLAPHKLA